MAVSRASACVPWRAAAYGAARGRVGRRDAELAAEILEHAEFERVEFVLQRCSAVREKRIEALGERVGGGGQWCACIVGRRGRIGGSGRCDGRRLIHGRSGGVGRVRGCATLVRGERSDSRAG